MWLLVIVNNLDLPGIAITQGETNAPLRVDANAMLPKPVPAQNFQPVAGRDPQVIEVTSRVNRDQFGTSPLLNLRGQSANGMACEDGRSVLAGKTLDHGPT